MQPSANESMKETPAGVSVATVVGLAFVSGVGALGLQSLAIVSPLGLAIVGLLLISPGCGQPI